MKEKLKNLIYSVIGYPKDVQHLLDSIEKFEDGAIIYPAGYFEFKVVTANADSTELLVFVTQQERKAFVEGLTHGIDIMGGSANLIKNTDIDDFHNQNIMTNKKVDPKKLN